MNGIFCPSVRLSVRLSHLFDYVPIIVSSWNFQELSPRTRVRSMQTRQIWGIWKLRPAYSPETPNLGQNRWCFVPCDLENWRMTLKNNRAPLLYYVKLCASFQTHWWSQTWVTAWKRSSRVKSGDFFVPHDLENWRMTLKINRASLLCCFNLCASFRSHRWIQTGVTVRKCLIWVKIDDFFSRVTMKFDGRENRKGAILFFVVIHQISRSHGLKKSTIWIQFG